MAKGQQRSNKESKKPKQKKAKKGVQQSSQVTETFQKKPPSKT